MLNRLSKYDNEIYTAPYWENDTVFHELLVFIRKNDDLPRAKLLYKPTEILAVKSATLEMEYIEGEDFTVENNEIILTKNSKIPIVDESELYTDSDSFPSKTTDKFYNYFNECSLFKREVAVTYKHNEKWLGYIPKYCGDILPRTTSMLKNKEPIKIAFIGDSITELGDISGSQKCAPFMPRYSEMVIERISSLIGTEIKYENVAVGGTSSDNFLKNEAIRNTIYNLEPDLVFIAYGMNDGGWIKPDIFVENIKAIIYDLKAKFPSCEFILISTVIPNRDACWSNQSPIYIYQSDYEKAMEILEEKGIALARITSIYSYMENIKGFYGMTATGINHPNDFTVRVYAQTILKMLFE